MEEKTTEELKKRIRESIWQLKILQRLDRACFVMLIILVAYLVFLGYSDKLARIDFFFGVLVGACGIGIIIVSVMLQGIIKRHS